MHFLVVSCITNKRNEPEVAPELFVHSDQQPEMMGLIGYIRKGRRRREGATIPSWKKVRNTWTLIFDAYVLLYEAATQKNLLDSSGN
jgi:hypothetical protein